MDTAWALSMVSFIFSPIVKASSSLGVHVQTDFCAHTRHGQSFTM